MEFGFWSPNRRKSFLMVQGVITDIQSGNGGGRGGGCSQFITLELENGDVVNFIVSADTFVVNFESLFVGMEAMFFYDAGAPAPLIYPPQYMAVAAAEVIQGQSVMLSFFDRNLLAADGSLQLNLDANVPVRTANNQIFMGNPGNRYLLAVYDRTTRSIPPQTTPSQVVVLCSL